MKLSPTRRCLPHVALAAMALSGFALGAIAQPSPTPAKKPASASTPIVAPSVSGPTFTTSSPPPTMLQGVISTEEGKAYMAFQQQLNDDPAIKELNAKIAKLAKELQQLRTESSALREKLTAANPEMKKIQDKISALMHSRTSNGPMPMPAPAGSTPATGGPMPISSGPTPAPGKSN